LGAITISATSRSAARVATDSSPLDGQLDAVAKESAGEYGVLNFAGSLKKVPGDLIFNQYRCRMFSHDCETLRSCICSGTSLRYRGHRVLAPGLKTEGAAMSNDDHKPMTEDQARKYRIKASGFRKTSTSMNPGRVSVSRWSRVFLANSTDVSRCCYVHLSSAASLIADMTTPVAV
jgi:hypothetical protein